MLTLMLSRFHYASMSFFCLRAVMLFSLYCRFSRRHYSIAAIITPFRRLLAAIYATRHALIAPHAYAMPCRLMPVTATPSRLMPAIVADAVCHYSAVTFIVTHADYHYSSTPAADRCFTLIDDTIAADATLLLPPCCHAITLLPLL